MKSYKNKLKGIVLAAAIAVGISMAANAGIQNTVFSGGTSNQYTFVAGAATNGPLVEIQTKEVSSVALSFKLRCDGANSTAIVFRIDAGDGAGNWVTNTLVPMSVTPNGTSYVTARTNYNVYGAPVIRIRAIENSGAGAITNLLINAWNKPGF